MHVKSVIGISVLLLLASVIFGGVFPLYAQSYDIIIKGGHVLDPKNNIDATMDIAIVGDNIAEVAVNIPASRAERTVDATGLYVTPGLIDIHSHNYYGTEPNSAYSNGFNSLPPDGFTFRAGVTTVVDVGGAGWRNFQHFKDQVIDRSQTRVLAFLNIVGHGMKGHPWEQNINDMDPKMTALVANQFDEIVGVKLAHYRADYSRNEWEQVDLLVEAGELADIPVMVDFGSADPPLSLETLVMEKFRPGDIYTHMYGGGGSGRQAVIDENGLLREGMLEAQDRGIIFDVGHGGGSFDFAIAIPAFEQGLRPNTISTDIHVNSMNAGMKNMLNVVSKMMNMGMSLQEVILASTWMPAKVIQREDLGHLGVGSVADIAVFSMHTGEFGFVDADNPTVKIIGDRKLETELTLRSGNIVYDLNGIAASRWSE